MRNVGPDLVAPDRYTGAEAAALIGRFDRLESNFGTHISQHPDKNNQYDRRIAVLESQYATLLRNQQRMLDKLDEL